LAFGGTIPGQGKKIFQSQRLGAEQRSFRVGSTRPTFTKMSMAGLIVSVTISGTWGILRNESPPPGAMESYAFRAERYFLLQSPSARYENFAKKCMSRMPQMERFDAMIVPSDCG